MKKDKSKLIFLCSMILVFLFSVTAAADDGKKIYEKKCVSCHGKDGKGNAAMVKMLKVDASLLNLIDKGTLDKSDEELISITSNGVNKMPAYGKEVKEEDIKGIISYIRFLTSK